MKFTPRSTARRSTDFAASGSGGIAPDAFPGDAHRAEAEPVDGEVTADIDRAGRAGRGVSHSSPLGCGARP